MLNNFLATDLMSYSEYRILIEKLLSENKTTGSNHSEEMIHYTKMNHRRMQRLDKTIQLNQSLKEKVSLLPDNLHFFTFTEAWCGDAAQNLPVINRVADLYADKISLKVLLRDENPELMDRYLTKGGKSIPKLVIFDQEGNELGTWGPRPAVLQEIIDKLKHEGENYKVVIEKAQLWYAKDKTQSTQIELEKLFYQILLQKSPAS